MWDRNGRDLISFTLKSKFSLVDIVQFSVNLEVNRAFQEA